MTRDILSEATRALREQTASQSDDVSRAAERRRARESRDRLVEGLRRPDTRRRRGLVWVPLAAILVGSSAWASGALPSAWEALVGSDDAADHRALVVDMPQPTVVDASAAPAPSTVTPADLPAEEEASAEDAPAELEAPAPQVSTAPAGVASEPAMTASNQPLTKAPSVAPKAVDDPAEALYRDAHQAHFGGGSAAVALQRWNAYLAKAPAGRFAPEASYNRALCLVRLGQHDAALAALAPFVAGSYGAYRQAEAKRIAQALTAKP